MREITQSRVTLFSLFLIIIGVYLSGISDDLFGNAVKYASISKELLLREDWMKLTYRGGEPYLQKPPLFFWVNTISLKLFGVNPLAYRIPSLLFFIFGLYSLFKLTTLCYNKETGLLATLLTACSLVSLMFMNNVKIDMFMMNTIIFAVWQFFLALKQNKWINYILGFIGCGIALLIKGPIGICIPAFIVAGEIISKKDWQNLLNIKWYIVGLPITLLSLLPATLIVYKQFGMDGVIFYFWTNNAGRISGEYLAGSRGPFFYIHTIAWLALPWSILLFRAVFLEAKQVWNNRIKKEGHGLFLGSMLFLIIISISSFKRQHYPIPILPFLFAITAHWTFPLLKHNPKWFSISHITLSVLLLLGALFVSFYFIPNNYSHLAILLMVIPVLLLFKYYHLSNGTKVLLTSLTSILIVGSLMNSRFYPFLLSHDGYIKACKIVNRSSLNDQALYQYRTYGEETFFYLNSPAHNLETLENWHPTQQHIWLLTDEEGKETFSRLHQDNYTSQLIKHQKVSQPKWLWSSKDRSQSLYLIKFKNSSAQTAIAD
ncbi:glycosyltransferase family 39 protein [Limibacter armeniacum]|uniref:ArnT family glycosyltransferase n=1 Tax=Limibacter armeniacum TaxID=466084 RepID=UPI002FE64C84